MFTFKLGTHREKKVIWIEFPYNKETKEKVKKWPGALYSWNKKTWYVPDNPSYRKRFGLNPPKPEIRSVVDLPFVNKQALKEFQQVIVLKGYSQNTQKSYTSEFIQYLKHIKQYDAATMPEEKIRSYLHYCHKTLKIPAASIHARMNALNFYYREVTKTPYKTQALPRPKKKKSLPNILSLEEIARILEVTTNLKHKMLLATAYGMGMRVSEVVKIKLADIDVYRNQLKINASKGKKDRFVTLSQVIKENLESYLKKYKPEVYLFEGQYKGPYTATSAQKIFRQAVSKAGILKPVTFHALRHSYATHLLEFGTDIRFIKELLGHNDIKTTMIYTHVTTKEMQHIESPLDKLLKGGKSNTN